MAFFILTTFVLVNTIPQSAVLLIATNRGAKREGGAGGALSPRPQLIEGPIIIFQTKLKEYGLINFALVILLLEGNYLLQIENLLLVINHLKSHALFHTILKMHAYR